MCVCRNKSMFVLIPAKNGWLQPDGILKKLLFQIISYSRDKEKNKILRQGQKKRKKKKKKMIVCAALKEEP